MKRDRMRVVNGGPSLAYILLHLISFSSKILFAADTLTLNQFLRDNQSLVSFGHVFELGFFSPGSSRFRYLGIWYKNIPFTVVWVANRDNPITGFFGSLSFGKDGNLLLGNRNNSIIWSTNSSTPANSPVAQILDNGNLVLREASNSNSETYIWQSFDYPTDTLLPGMKLGWDLRTGLDRKLTPWKSLDDPSPGNFSYSVEGNGHPQLVLRMGSNELYRSGLWYENQFSGGPVLMENSVFHPMFVANSEEAYFVYETTDPTILIRLVIVQSGLVQQFTRNSHQLQWVILFTIQQDRCDTYNLCGSFGICDINSSPNCKCMTGFTPEAPQDWEVFDTFGGCVRRLPLKCGEKDGFMKYSAMKLPDTLSLQFNEGMTTKECETLCLKNCNCSGYAEFNASGDGKGCFIWLSDLVDVRKAINGYGQDLHVRLSASAIKSIEDSRERKRRGLRRIVASSVLSTAFLLGLILWFVIWSKKKKRIKKKTNGGNRAVLNETCCLRENHEEDEEEYPLFDLATVAAATDHFSLSNKIGEGGFGPVYKGTLPTGQEIAVKRLSQESRQGINQLKNEVLLISKLQHRNLVRLLGCCIHQEERMLIYEYMANRSLDTFIFDKARRKQLGWELRFNIIVGIARGVLYLHRDSRLRIIHRDLKASNVLLDKEMNPKISDFGMARTLSGDQTEEYTKVVVGTYGYMSPEYAVDSNFSLKSDVFSFGVLVLEIVSGRRNRGFYDAGHDLNLLGHAWKLWDEGKALEVIDPAIAEKFKRNEALRCIHVGLLCVQQRPEDRPTMSSVLMILDGEGLLLPEPKQPGFFAERYPSETDSSARKRRGLTSNEVTMTSLEGR